MSQKTDFTRSGPAGLLLGPAGQRWPAAGLNRDFRRTLGGFCGQWDANTVYPPQSLTALLPIFDILNVDFACSRMSAVCKNRNFLNLGLITIIN